MGEGSQRKNLPFFYGWVILGLSFLGLFATFGIRASFGAYVTSWEEEFVINRTAVTLISTLNLVIFALFQPIMGRMSDRFGVRPVLTISLVLVGSGLILSSMVQELWQLVFLYGVVAAIGLAGGSNVTATALVAHWFVEKRGLAMGLVLSGMAVGQLVVGPASILIIHNFDWRFALFVIGLIILLVVMPIILIFIRSKPEDMNLRPYGEKNEALTLPEDATHQNPEDATQQKQEQAPAGSMFAVFREPVFWILTIPYFICGFTDVGFIGTHFIPFAEGKGHSEVLIAVAFGTIAAFNIAGTIGTGYLSDRISRSKLLAVIYWIRAIMFILLVTVDNPSALFIFAVFYGLTEMASIAPTSSLCAHLFKNMSIGAVFGFVSVSHQLGAAFGALVPGAVFDLTGSYTLVFIVSVVALVGSGFMVLRVPDSQKYTAKPPANKETAEGQI